MANFLKLTQANGTPIVVNADHISTMYVPDVEDKRFKTYVWVLNHSNMPQRVKEPLDSIMGMINEFTMIEDTMSNETQPSFYGK